jgi:hypothetical protein
MGPWWQWTSRRMYIFHRNENTSHHLGIGFFLHKRIRSDLLVISCRWCDIIVLNVHAPMEDASDNKMGSFCEELQRVSDQYSKYHIKILWQISLQTCWEVVSFKPTVGNESSHETSNDNGVRVVNCATSKMFNCQRVQFSYIAAFRNTLGLTGKRKVRLITSW